MRRAGSNWRTRSQSLYRSSRLRRCKSLPKRASHIRFRPAARRSLTALALAVQIFVQLQPCAPDADEINDSIRVQISGDTGGAWHSSGVDHLFCPPPCIVRTIKEDARCTLAEAGDHLVAAIAVEIRGNDCVAVYE